MDNVKEGIEDQLEKLMKWAREDVNVSFAKLLYVIFVLSLSFIWNIHAVTEGISYKDTREKVAKHQLFVIVLIVIALGLIIYQFIWNLKNSKKRLKHRPMPLHLVAAVWFLGIVTIFFECWMIAHFALFSITFHCDDIVKISADSRNFQVASRLLYHSFMVVYIFMQTIWLHLINIYAIKPITLKHRFFHSFAYLHVIVLNLVIYLKTTLDEAQHSWEHVEEQEAGAGNDGEEKATANDLQHIVDATSPPHRNIRATEHDCGDPRVERAHSLFMEPIGFAILIETLLTFCLLAWLFAKLEEHERYEAIEHTIEEKALQEANTDLVKERRKITRQDSDIRENPNSPTSRLKLMINLARVRFQKYPMYQRIMAVIISLLLLISGALSLYLFIEFFSAIRSEMKLNPGFYESYLILRIILYVFLTISAVYCMYYQKRSLKALQRLKIRGHVKLDLNLLLISLISILLFNEFLMQAAASPPEHLHIETGSKVLHFLDSLLCVFQALSQVLLIARALTYKTHLGPTSASPDLLCLFALLFFNFVLWLVELFERKYANVFNRAAREYYNEVLWVIVTEVTYPLMIFYHFHSMFVIFTLLAKHLKHKKSRWLVTERKVKPTNGGTIQLQDAENGTAEAVDELAMKAMQ